MSNQPVPTVLGIRHAAISVSDLDRAIRFYCDVFGFQTFHTGDSDWAMLVLGDTSLSLIRATTEGPPVDSRWRNGSHYSHVGITVAAPEIVERIHRGLSNENVASVGKLTAHRDGSYGFYLRDPDDNPLECIFIPLRSQILATPKEAWIVVAGERSSFTERLPERLHQHIGSVYCEVAYLAQRPGVAEVLTRLVRDGAAPVFRVVPLFVTTAFENDIERLVETLRRRFPKVKLDLLPAVGQHWLVQEALIGAIVRTALH